MRPRHAIAVILMFAAIAGCAESGDAGTGGTSELAPLPEPGLDAMDAPVREAILDLRRALADSPQEERAAAHGALGRMYYAYGMQDAAEACFLNADRLDGTDFAPAYFLALILLERGELDQATRYLRTVLQRRQDYTAARIRLGRALLELGDAAGGREQLKQALRDGPYAAAAGYSLGRLAASAGDHQTAVTHFEQVLELQPEATRVHYPLGQAYRRLGDNDSASRHVEASGDRDVVFPDPVMESLRQLTAGASDLLNTSGRAFFAGEFAAAADGYRQAIAIDPESVEAHKGLALALERLGDLSGAERHFRQARRLSPTDPDVERGLGLLLRRRGATHEALASIRRAVELDPGSADARLALAETLQAAGHFDEALPHLDEVLRVDPLHRRARVERATALFGAGRHEQALEALGAALESDPGHHEAAMTRGALLARVGRTDDAEAVLRDLLDREVEPELRARTLFNLGVIESVRGNESGSLQHYREALEADPGNGEARFYYAAGLARSGRYAEAADWLQPLVDQQPLDLRARLAEATALVYAGRHAVARRRLEEGLTATGGEPLLGLALAKLLSTSSEDGVRDGAQALVIARQLHDARPSLEHTEVLAMALAESGDFAQAVTLQRELVARASEMGEAGLVRQFQQDLARYERSEPARAP